MLPSPTPKETTYSDRKEFHVLSILNDESPLPSILSFEMPTHGPTCSIESARPDNWCKGRVGRPSGFVSNPLDGPKVYPQDEVLNTPSVCVCVCVFFPMKDGPSVLHVVCHGLQETSVFSGLTNGSLNPGPLRRLETRSCYLVL